MRKIGMVLAALAVFSGNVFAAEYASPKNDLSSLPGMRSISPARHVPRLDLLTELQAIPNPFDSRLGGVQGCAFLYYTLERDAQVSVTIYARDGRRVQGWTLPQGSLGAQEGHNSMRWNGEDETGAKVPAGHYAVEVIAQTSRNIVTGALQLTVIR